MTAKREIEQKWQQKWEEAKIFEANKDDKPTFYALEMFPYPSGAGLHIGHAVNYGIGDIYARKKFMEGYNVLHPMGYDALGLPAENAAIKAGTHPEEYTKASILNFTKQLKALGYSYDWSRLINTSDPNYYKWDQWIFLELFKKGLAYKKESPVNWCPKCNTVLANEQVQNGVCWRHEDTKVEVKSLSQWYFKTTQYAEELNDMSKLEQWPEKITKLQTNWIGKSHGSEVTFTINGDIWNVFTTRPDTLMGVTFLVISAQHPRLLEITTNKQKADVEAFASEQSSVSQEDIDQLEKKGVFTGAHAQHPITGEDIPVYAGNFVLADYGSGMVMAVPAHDQRDYDFAKKYDIPIKVVIENTETEKAFTGNGKLINSGEFDGMQSGDAKEHITKKLEEIGKGKKTTNYRLRDWLVSRQRYWGTPIPIIYCEQCGAVPDENLPVKLPHDVTFGDGNPLATSESFVNTTCPKCQKPAKRETDTMDTFVNSSWYQLRYTDPHNAQEIFSKDQANKWMPVDMYIGGAEHACMHLIYVRFYTKFLRDLGLVQCDEPAIRVFNQGLLHAEDGRKMSKSFGNVINPLDIIEEHGADPLRLFLVSVAAPDSDFSWSEKGFQSTVKFLDKVVEYYSTVKQGKSTPYIEHKINSLIRDVSEDIEKMKYNLAVIKLRGFFDLLQDEESKETLEAFLKLLSPFCPHSTEELWEKIGNSAFISLADWPKADESKINPELEEQEAYAKDLTDDISTAKELAKLDTISSIKLITSPNWKYDLYALVGKELSNDNRDFKDIIGKIMSTDLKEHSKDITRILPSLIKKGVSSISKETEEKLLNDSIESLKEQFQAEITIESANDSQEPKAKNAAPSKPAILLA